MDQTRPDPTTKHWKRMWTRKLTRLKFPPRQNYLKMLVAGIKKS